jgi:hypothetical protein
VFRVYSGKFCGAIDEKPEGFAWSIRLSALAEDEPPITEGTEPTMNAALTEAYKSLTGLIAATGNA